MAASPQTPGQPSPSAAKNILGGPLAACSAQPLTGFFRDGCCRTDEHDHGRHIICALMTEKFLRFSVAQGNDLSTPRPEFEFPGLKPGDRWCVCATRWKEALEASAAPPVVLEACHEAALKFVTLEQLQSNAVLG